MDSRINRSWVTMKATKDWAFQGLKSRRLMKSREQFISYQQINVLSSSPSKIPSRMSATRTKMTMPPYILDQWSTYGVLKGLAQWTTNSHQLVNFLVQVSLSLLTSKEGKIKVSSSKHYATLKYIQHLIPCC
jgi:hypothetical protein